MRPLRALRLVGHHEPMGSGTCYEYDLFGVPTPPGDEPVPVRVRRGAVEETGIRGDHHGRGGGPGAGARVRRVGLPAASAPAPDHPTREPARVPRPPVERAAAGCARRPRARGGGARCDPGRAPTRPGHRGGDRPGERPPFPPPRQPWGAGRAQRLPRRGPGGRRQAQCAHPVAVRQARPGRLDRPRGDRARGPGARRLRPDDRRRPRAHLRARPRLRGGGRCPQPLPRHVAC